MTLAMPDSIYPQNLPGGYPAYLGYRDGSWPDFEAERQRFPSARILGLAVTASDDAEGLDIEFRDATPDQAPGWAERQIIRGVRRPVLYASTGTMPAVIADLASAGISRDRVRLLSAHYGLGEHICGPKGSTLNACGYPGIPPMDGTQWTNEAPGLGGSRIDMSALDDSFFGTPVPVPAPSYAEFDMAKLPVLRQGDTDRPGHGFWSVHRLQALLAETGKLNGLTVAADLADDGDFGPETAAAVRAVEEHYRRQFPQMIIDAAGHESAGPQVWSVLLTGNPG